MNTRNALAVAGLLAMAALGWILVGPGLGQRTSSSGEPLTLRFFTTPQPVKAFTMTDIDGRTISSDSLRGKVIIVNFWATWCPPCRAEIPDLVALQEKYGDKLQVIGVSQDEGGPDVVRPFAAAHRMNYPIVMSTVEIEKIFTGLYALPTSFMVDREFRIVQKHVGMLNAELTEAETRSLAGLSVNAKIEYVDDTNQALIKDAAQATKIPGIDLDKLSASAKTATLQKLNSENCTCGCGLTLAACRINDPKCTISLPIAQKIAEDAAAIR